jgi:hypothetical protein
VLLGDDASSASKAEVDDGSLYAESVSTDEGHLDSLETVIRPTTPIPPSNPDVWHDINNFLEMAQMQQRRQVQPSHLP